MIDVTLENFETEVIAASMQTPVLVDFWAPWCGPCKVIGPMLEKLETEYGGRFKLVKIDSDQEQQLAGAFGIKSIPTCILLKGGQPVDGFMGAVPEGQLKAFLDRHVPAAEELEAEAAEAEALDALAEGNTDAALEKLQHAVATDPANDDARFDYVKLLLQLGRSDDAKVAFAPVIAKAAADRRLEALQHWMDAIDSAADNDDLARATAGFDQKIAANKRDFDARFGKARALMAAQQWTDAMDELLEIVMRDKAWNNEAARKVFVSILELIAPPKPKAAAGTEGKTAGGIEIAGKALAAQDPQAELVSRYRRRLSMTLN
ncbi:MAG: thioredoxin [Ramlibacter sp.]|nr:thioredoxin [Ramlibacter sp.]